MLINFLILNWVWKSGLNVSKVIWRVCVESVMINNSCWGCVVLSAISNAVSSPAEAD